MTICKDSEGLEEGISCVDDNLTFTEINFGPQHPAAHGVLRMILSLDGEEVRKADPHIGYLHRGTEKLIESKTYFGALPYFDRLDYVSPIAQEHAYSLCVEKLLGIDIPERASYLRVLFCELTRILNHCLNISSHALDAGATTPLLWMFEEREKIMEFCERVSGARMHCTYVRPGGVLRDIDDSFSIDLEKFLQGFEKIADDVRELLHENRIWKGRNYGIGVIDAKEAIKRAFTGPPLRACGIPWDLRRAQPYEKYKDLEFKIPIGSCGDAYDRYAVRAAEMIESVSIIRQCLQKMPKGPVSSNDPIISIPTRTSMKFSMESMIRHFKLFSEGYSVPEGEAYVGVESPKGEFGVQIISDGSNRPFRCRIRAPGFPHLQAMDYLCRGSRLSDVPVILGSLDIVFGEIDR